MEHRTIPKASVPLWLRSEENKVRQGIPGDRVKDYALKRRKGKRARADRKRNRGG